VGHTKRNFGVMQYVTNKTSFVKVFWKISKWEKQLIQVEENIEAIL
jgi:hypothetical protein